MSAYKDALHIKSNESGDRLALAEDLLVTGQGVVVIDGALALRPNGNTMLCEVIAGNLGHDFVSSTAAAKDLLACSTIASLVGRHNHQWLVVEDYGTGTVELWRAS